MLKIISILTIVLIDIIAICMLLIIMSFFMTILIEARDQISTSNISFQRYLKVNQLKLLLKHQNISVNSQYIRHTGKWFKVNHSPHLHPFSWLHGQCLWCLIKHKLCNHNSQLIRHSRCKPRAYNRHTILSRCHLIPNNKFHWHKLCKHLLHNSHR